MKRKADPASTPLKHPPEISRWASLQHSSGRSTDIGRGEQKGGRQHSVHLNPQAASGIPEGLHGAKTPSV